MSIRVHEGKLVNHAHAVDALAKEVRTQARALDGVNLGTDTFGLMNAWMPSVLNSFFIADSDTVLDMADTLGKCAEAVRSAARDMARADDAVAHGMGGTS